MSNERGFSLVEVLVGLAIVTVMMAAFGSFMDSSSRSTKGLTQKMEILQLQQEILGDLANASVCGCNLDQAKNGAAAALNFNSNLAPAQLKAAQFSLGTLFAACNAAGNAPANPTVVGGQKLQGSLTGLVVK